VSSTAPKCNDPLNSCTAYSGLNKDIRNERHQRSEALDLTNQAQVNAFFEQEKPDQVYLAAAKVGGIYANNTYPAEFITKT
jgi:nucleoside-diphosphate-sugar epimerase